jgi:amylosucrase
MLEDLGLVDKKDARFSVRLSAGYEQIERLVYQLYGKTDKSNHFISRIVEKIYQGYKSRNKTLLELDKIREEDPYWFLRQNLVGMMLYTDKFSKDLKNFTNRVDYLEELGVNLVHLMPLLKCPPKNNDGGYAVSDFRDVNPELGTIEDVERISKELHRKGMYLMLDLTVNHTSDQHEWANRARKGEEKYQDYYYFYPDRVIPDQFEQSLPEVFPENAPGNFTYQNQVGKWVMTVFHDYQWDLNYTNPEVFLEMLDILLFLANCGVDFIRLDALAFTWKKIGTTSQNLDEAHKLMQLFKACSQIAAPGMVFIAEAIVAPKEIIKYFGEDHNQNDECDIAYNATLMTLLWDAIATKKKRLLEVSLSNIPKKIFGRTWLNYIRCHDDIGLGYEDLHAQWAGYDPFSHRKFLTDFLIGNFPDSFSVGKEFMRDPQNDSARISGSLASLAGLEKAKISGSGYEIDLAIDRICLLHAVIISYGGIPMLYMGDELAFTNDYSYLDDPDKANDNRWIHRPSMNWDIAENRNKPSKIEYQVFHRIQHLISLRKQRTEFSDLNNTFLVETYNQHVFAYLRVAEKFRTLCVYNFNDKPEPLYKNVVSDQFDKEVKDIIKSESVDFITGNYMLKPFEYLWITDQN